MSDVMTFAVGKPMPYQSPSQVAPDSPTIRTTTDFLDIHLYSAQPQRDRIMWQTDQAQLGLFVQDEVPYLLVHFPKSKVTFDCPFNICRVADEIRTVWFASDKAIVQLILASYPTNLFYGMQRISAEWAAELRRISERTMHTYKTAEAIERQQRIIEVRCSTAQMWQQRWRNR